MSDRLVNVSLRLPPPMVSRLDALVPQAAAAPELVTVGTPTRSDLLRVAVLRGLASLEAELTEHPRLPLGEEG